MSTEAEPEAPPTPDLAAAKPPFLRRVRLRNYKSIAFCDVSLEPLTILVGRNASGKSYFLDALGFLADLMEMKTTDAVGKRNGWHSIHCRDSASPYVDFEIEASLTGNSPKWDAVFSATLVEEKNHQIRVAYETLTLRERGGTSRCGYKRSGSTVEWIGQPDSSSGKWARVNDDGTNTIQSESETPIHPYFFRPPQPDRLLLSVLGAPPLSELAEEFHASGVYDFLPSKMRPPQPLNLGPVLEPDGRNLARAIEGLREIEPAEIERIEQFLSAIVPEIDTFRAISYGNYETIRFRLKPIHGREPQEFDAAEMSDGTLRVLAALVASRQIYLPTNAYGFIGIEEPETALHPDAMRALVEALDEATLVKQIILTTHSPDLLDAEDVKPEHIRVVEMVDGETVIGTVDEASVEIVKRKLDTLGGLERQKHLEPNTEDVARQRALSRNGQGHPV